MSESYDEQSGTVSMGINPWEVVCLARLPKILQLERREKTLDIRLKQSFQYPSLKVLVDYDDGKEQGQCIKIHNDRARIDLSQFTGERLIIKLFNNGYLIDERIIKL